VNKTALYACAASIEYTRRVYSQTAKNLQLTSYHLIAKYYVLLDLSYFSGYLWHLCHFWAISAIISGILPYSGYFGGYLLRVPVRELCELFLFWNTWFEPSDRPTTRFWSRFWITFVHPCMVDWEWEEFFLFHMDIIGWLWRNKRQWKWTVTLIFLLIPVYLTWWAKKCVMHPENLLFPLKNLTNAIVF